jgi:hypothetical protein
VLIVRKITTPASIALGRNDAAINRVFLIDEGVTPELTFVRHVFWRGASSGERPSIVLNNFIEGFILGALVPSSPVFSRGWRVPFAGRLKV